MQQSPGIVHICYIFVENYVFIYKISHTIQNKILYGVVSFRTYLIYICLIFVIGTMFGTVLTFGTSGVLCQYGFDNGWASIFYITGNYINILFISKKGNRN